MRTRTAGLILLIGFGANLIAEDAVEAFYVICEWDGLRE